MKGYNNVDEEKLFSLFIDKENEYTMPVLKGSDVIATEGHRIIYVRKEVCEGQYEPTDKYNLRFLEERRGITIPLKLLQDTYDRLPKIEHEHYDEESCAECNGTGKVEWEYCTYGGEVIYKDHDCPICNGEGNFTTNIRLVREVPYYLSIDILGNVISAVSLKALIDTLTMLGKQSVELVVFKDKKKSLVKFFVDENIKIAFAQKLRDEPVNAIISFKQIKQYEIQQKDKAR